MTSLRDDQLIGAVAEATEAREADRLLLLMTEIRARGLLMFEVEGQVCEPVIPESGLLATLTPHGTAQWAYITRVRMMAMELRDCGCLYSLQSFDEFTRDMTGSRAPDLTRSDLATLQEFRAKNQSPVDDAWRDYRKTVCGE